jgi:hypothetical protein
VHPDGEDVPFRRRNPAETPPKPAETPPKPRRNPAETPPKPLSGGRQAFAAASADHPRHSGAIPALTGATNRRARTGSPPFAESPARELSQFRLKICAVFLTPRRPAQDEKKLSRLPAKK